MIDKVICIQQEKAEDSGLYLEGNFVNFKEDDQIMDGIMDELSKIGSTKRFDPVIYTDEQRVMQVLLNLQSNALKFTRKGGVTHHVEIIEEQTPLAKETFLKISVTDTGVGIPWEDQDKLFKLFGFV